MNLEDQPNVDFATVFTITLGIVQMHNKEEEVPTRRGDLEDEEDPEADPSEDYDNHRRIKSKKLMPYY